VRRLPRNLRRACRSGCDTPEVLQSAEGSFNAPAILVAVRIVSDGALAIDPAGNDRFDSVSSESLAQGISVITLVSNEPSKGFHHGEKVICGTNVTDVACAQADDRRTA